jgi:hypothetical protein
MASKSVNNGIVVLGSLLAAAGLACDAELERASSSSASAPRSGQDPPPSGEELFEEETFQGNGRTCRTCHSAQTGTLSPAQVQAAFADDPQGPLFRELDSDDGLGLTYDRLLDDATILVTMELPPGWHLADDPLATEVVLARGIPTTRNVPSLDDLFMVDGRFLSLRDQALAAIEGHAEPGRSPTLLELEAIAQFQQTNAFFNNRALQQWSNGGPRPELPLGTTAAEQRGREWFLPTPTGACAFCHSGPMLDETNEFLPTPPVPVGTRILTAFVSELNPGNQPVRTFVVDDGEGGSTSVETPDPGRALVTGDLADLNMFRIPTLWGTKYTAPYFHDNSAADLDAMVEHYSDAFVFGGLPALTEREQADIVAYMRLL